MSVLILGAAIPFQELSIKFLDVAIGQISLYVLRYKNFETRK